MTGTANHQYILRLVVACNPPTTGAGATQPWLRFTLALERAPAANLFMPASVSAVAVQHVFGSLLRGTLAFVAAQTAFYSARSDPDLYDATVEQVSAHGTARVAASSSGSDSDSDSTACYASDARSHTDDADLPHRRLVVRWRRDFSETDTSTAGTRVRLCVRALQHNLRLQQESKFRCFAFTELAAPETLTACDREYVQNIRSYARAASDGIPLYEPTVLLQLIQEQEYLLDAEYALRTMLRQNFGVSGMSANNWLFPTHSDVPHSQGSLPSYA